MEEIQTRYEKLMDNFQGDRTGLFDRVLEKYKEKEILIKGTEEVLENYRKLLETRKKDFDEEKNFIDYLMKASNETKVESKFGKISYRKTPGKVVITGNVSEDYKEIVEVEKIDKNKIKEDIKEGKVLDFATIEYGENLSIK